VKDSEIDAFFSHDRCVRESGHDTTYRFFEGGGERCADFAPVELNALLFKYEIDLARLIDEHLGGQFRGRTGAEFCERARARARLMQTYHWDEAAGLFFDYDLKKRRRSSYVSATTLVPLWASGRNRCDASLLTAAMAERVKKTALSALEVEGGLSATAAGSRERVAAPRVLVQAEKGGFSYQTNERQWEFPNGWAPHQMFAWKGLENFGFERDAHRLAYRWLATIVSNAADYHGTVPEKFDVVRRSHRVFEEYGNVNTEFSYISSEGFGWMNASFVVGRGLLSPAERTALGEHTPVERVFPEPRESGP
jgi:alpha,alpha-trehalase